MSLSVNQAPGVVGWVLRRGGVGDGQVVEEEENVRFLKGDGEGFEGPHMWRRCQERREGKVENVAANKS